MVFFDVRISGVERWLIKMISTIQYTLKYDIHYMVFVYKYTKFVLFCNSVVYRSSNLTPLYYFAINNFLDDIFENGSSPTKRKSPFLALQFIA